MQALLPDNRFQSPTAVPGKTSMRDEYLYSAFIAGDGGAGNVSVFTVPKGQTIPILGSSSVTAANHQRTYGLLTTNFTKAGEAGSALGDFAIRQLNVDVEQAWYDASGVQNTYGAADRELKEIQSKTFMEFKIAGKKQIEGPLRYFPTIGGASGGISTTENAVTVSTTTNGWPGGHGKRLRIPIPVSRTDTVEAIVSVAGGASLSFTTSNGNPTLVWCGLSCILAGDAR